MAVTTDLQDFHTIETTPTFFEFTNYTTGGTPVVDTDYPIQGTQHMSAAMTKTGLGSIGIDYGSNPTWTSGWVFFVWGVFLPASAVDTDSGGGLRVLIGSGSGAFKIWYVGGSDFGRYPYGGWQNFVVDPETTGSTTDVGSPTSGQYRYAGFGWNCTAAISKGSPAGLDAIRFGRGEIRVNGTETFTSMASANDTSSARWGLFQSEAGSYRWKGLMTLGYSSSVSITDSNKNIIVDNTRRVTSGFNKIEIRQSGSTVSWTNINITALGTVSKGAFQMIDAADVDKVACSFTDMDTFIYLSSANISGTTYRRCGQVTLGGATMSGCLFDRSTASISLTCGSSISTLSNTDFISDGSNHAIEITGGTSHTLNGLTFTSYAAYQAGGTSTGNEALYINIPSGSVTIYADSQVSYRTAGATVNIVAGSVSFTVTVVNISGTPISGASVALFAKDATGDLPYQDSISVSSNGTTATVSHTGHGMQTGDKVLIAGLSNTGLNGVYTITVTGADAYTYSTSITQSSISGTATWCALFGTTDANGQITDSRVFSTNQPVTGWARKSTSAPYYKTGQLNGTISSSTGADLSTLLLLDQ